MVYNVTGMFKNKQVTWQSLLEWRVRLNFQLLSFFSTSLKEIFINIKAYYYIVLIKNTNPRKNPSRLKKLKCLFVRREKSEKLNYQSLKQRTNLYHGHSKRNRHGHLHVRIRRHGLATSPIHFRHHGPKSAILRYFYRCVLTHHFARHQTHYGERSCTKIMQVY